MFVSSVLLALLLVGLTDLLATAADLGSAEGLRRAMAGSSILSLPVLVLYLRARTHIEHDLDHEKLGTLPTGAGQARSNAAAVRGWRSFRAARARRMAPQLAAAAERLVHPEHGEPPGFSTVQIARMPLLCGAQVSD